MKLKVQDRKTATISIFILLIGLFNYAQEAPFNCDYNAYLFQYNDIYALDLASGNSYLVKENVTTGNVNAVGYNPADGYIWGSLSTPSRSIVRIGKNFNTQVFYIPELPTSNRYVGDVREDGIYYLKPGGSTYYLVDINPNSSNYGKFQETKTLTQNLNIHDWAFNAVDGMLYTVEKKTNNLYRIDPESGDVLNLGIVPILEGLNYTFGAVYFDVEGRFYVSANQTGTVYVINDVQNLELGSSIVSNLFAFGPSSSLNDGARCPTAPVPQEDCVNGIDDDGDGLTDCDDPACSGIAECPTIDLEVSTGNDGGLESNDRLSSLINKRNYLRSKSNYTFNKAHAKKVVKTKSYKKTASKSSEFTLKDLIPLDIIPGTEAIESSPADLLTITNATELFSVDYVKEDKTIAVILATKTENGVYEHTKYICDRLLGAELLSVSTIEIKGQTFIKSIIKNRDGSKEFVLSFSGRLSQDNNNFLIESHWNIDKYTANQTFYNFQIWTNKVDDLITLGAEALELFETQKTITAYHISTPPPVFVKKGKYVDGALELEIINTNKTQNIVFDAGFKRTESSQTEYSNKTIALDGNYITTLRINTGNIFDIGFRIENDKNQTPDDLFMSDGPWGVDDSSEDTTIDAFLISQNEQLYAGNGYRVERNIALKATTKSYVAAYRAFTPRFKAVDLSDFDVLEFDASGTGTIEITIIKETIAEWKNQFKTTVTLDDNESHYAIPLAHFKSSLIDNIDLKDAVSIVFTMSSNGVDVVSKEMNLKNIDFYKQVLSTGDAVFNENETIVYPNPLQMSSELSFYSEIATTSTLEIYNLAGVLIKSIVVEVEIGNNSIQIFRDNLKSGLYLMKLSNKFRNYTVKKLVVN
ncbi:T9SS C-terminal target domain-containing protein [Polaribacter sp. WD7]|uniref:T9SS type A sorting domain-containing protein n=1 Tax=Polaribacter sp. WD7 TaxID=2269061 RepID=UPI000DF26B60|nr:T9SS type A sorting domain-containing protein [Polaribacter sp. WD7]RCS27990.1 T9SS C-terminal target domain-containing protein [Polaribacter sp. WD7]